MQQMRSSGLAAPLLDKAVFTTRALEATDDRGGDLSSLLSLFARQDAPQSFRGGKGHRFRRGRDAPESPLEGEGQQGANNWADHGGANGVHQRPLPLSHAGS